MTLRLNLTSSRLLAYFLLFVGSASFWARAGEVEIPKQIPTEKNWLDDQLTGKNPLVPRGKLPETEALLGEWQGPLNRGLQSLLQETYTAPPAVTAEFLIGSSPEVNAKVTLVTAEAGQFKLKIVVNRGLLAAFFRKNDLNSLRAIQGALAHELGHSIDFFDAQGFTHSGIENATSSRGVSQAREIRADLDAVQILRAAGFADDGVLLALESLGKNSSPWVNGLMGSHPQNQARQSAHRLGLTVLRGERGDTAPKTVQTSAGRISRLSQEWADPIARMDHAVPPVAQQTSALFGRLDELGKKFKAHRRTSPADPEYLKKIKTEGWQRLLELDRAVLLAEKSGTFTAQDRERYQDLMLEILQTPQQDGFFLFEFNYWTSETLKSRRAHSALIQNIKALQETSYLEKIKKLIPSEKVFRKLITFGDQISGSIPAVSFRKALLPLDPDQGESTYSIIYQKSALGRKAYGKSFSMQLGDIQSQNSLPLIEKAKDTNVWPRIKLDLAPPYSKEETEALRTAAQHVWKYRGAYGLVDLRAHSAVDWESVFQILGIPVMQGWSQVGEAVIALVRNGGLNDLPKPTSQIGNFRGQRSWINSRVVEALRASPWNDLDAIAYGLMPQDQRAAWVKRNLDRAVLNSAPFSDWTADTLSSLLQLHGDLEKRSIAGDMKGWAKYWAAEWLNQKIPPSPKRDALMRDLLLDPDGMLPITFTQDTITRARVKLISQARLKPSIAAVLEDRFGNGNYSEWMFSNYFFHSIESLTHELSRTKNLHQLQKFLELLAKAKDEQILVGNPEKFFEFRSLLARQAMLSTMDTNQRVAFHLRLSQLGPTPDSDQLLKTVPIETLSPAVALEWIAQAKIFNSRERIRLARLLSERLWLSQPGALLKQSQLESAVEGVARLLPQASVERDDLLEKIIWASPLRDAEAIRTVERYKSSNLRAMDPSWVDWFSQMGEVLVLLPKNERLSLARYLMNPLGRKFPADVETFFSQRIDQKLRWQVRGGHLSQDQLDAQKYAAVRKAIQFAENSSPMQKIPAFEILLAGGEFPLAADANGRQQVLHQLLDKKPHTTQEKLHLAYLDSIPREERSVALAYLLAHHNGGDTDVNAIASAFKTVGFKFGQQGALWQLFGEEGSKRAATLKDQADPLTLREITDILDTRLPPNERSQIKQIVRILGSASVKGAVVEVALTNGKTAVVLMRRPRIEEQVKRNLRLAQEFLVQVKKQGVPLNEQASRSLLDSVAAQLKEELPLKAEAQQILRAQQVYREIAPLVETGGWRVRVPGLVPEFSPQDDLIVMEKAHGISLNQLKEISASDQKQVEKMIGQTGVRGLFRLGWLNADPHRGQFLVDPVTRTLSPIDFGQAVQLGYRSHVLDADEVHDLALWLKAVSEQDAETLVKYGLRLSEQPQAGPTIRKKIKQGIQEVLKRKSAISDQLLGLSAAFADAGAPLKTKISFGVFKGLATLAQEQFFGPGEFEKEIRTEVRSVLLRKAPRTALEFTRDACLRPILKMLQH